LSMTRMRARGWGGAALDMDGGSWWDQSSTAASPNGRIGSAHGNTYWKSR
jgi:hypothetical protein